MTSSLNDSLQIILPNLSRALVTADALDPIVRLAQLLPPIHCAGFECRLDGNNSHVDFQQRILADQSEPEQLRHHILRSGWVTVSPWTRIDAFCSHLNNPSSVIYNMLSEFWLEFDILSSPPSIPAPSIFLSFKRPFPENIFLKIATGVLVLLQDRPAPASLLSNLRHICRVCPEGAGSTDIGILLARNTEIIRANLGTLPPDRIKSFLEKIRWCGNMDAFVNTYQRLSVLADRMSLCLDVGAEIYPRIGLECFIHPQTDNASPWAQLIDELTGSGLCTHSKGEALQLWPGFTYPTSSPVPWPVGLMIESMLGPSDRFSVMGRRLSHIKLDFRPQQSPSAKAYFGFGRLWLQPEASKVNEMDGSANRNSIWVSSGKEPAARNERLDDQKIISSIQRGITFLMRVRSPEGWWHDFYDLHGGSDEYMTAYTGSALAALSDDRARDTARRAWALLASRRQPLEGWGWNAVIPADADSTSWGLRLAKSLGQEDSERARMAVRFLKRHLHPNGGVSTFSEKYFRDFTGRSDRASLEGWCQPHPEVTAAAATVEGFGKSARRFLRNNQHPDGYWKAYWDCDVEYATALAAEALADGRHPGNVKCLQRAVQWATNRFDTNGRVISKALSRPSATASACCIRILVLAKNKNDIFRLLNRAVSSLITEQQRNGAWLPSLKMREPPTFVLDPEKEAEGTLISLDHQSIFTTATVLSALESVRRHLILA